METRLSEELITISTRLMLANDKCEIIRIATDINNAVEKLLAYEKSGTKALAPQKKSVSGILKFTNKEIQNSQMAKTFKKEFIANGLCAHVIKRESGKNSFCYEIRYRSNGYKIEVSSTDLATAKKKFLEKTKPSEIDKYRKDKGIDNHQRIPTRFEDFAWYYFCNFRQKEVCKQTYQNDERRLIRYIIPALGKMCITQITPKQCQDLIDRVFCENKCKTAVEIYNILRCIYRTAIAHDLLTKSPMDIVKKPTYVQKSGKALSKDDVVRVLTAKIDQNTKIILAIALFCGLRPNELSTAVLEGDFIKAVNSKQQKKTKQHTAYKYIPIAKQLKPFLEDGIPSVENLNILRKKFKSILPEHILYDCRTTFYSRCKECGVAIEALEEFMGHSLGKIGNAYTDLSREYLYKEGTKLFYDI